MQAPTSPKKAYFIAATRRKQNYCNQSISVSNSKHGNCNEDKTDKVSAHGLAQQHEKADFEAKLKALLIERGKIQRAPDSPEKNLFQLQRLANRYRDAAQSVFSSFRDVLLLDFEKNFGAYTNTVIQREESHNRFGIIMRFFCLSLRNPLSWMQFFCMPREIANSYVASMSGVFASADVHALVISFAVPFFASDALVVPSTCHLSTLANLSMSALACISIDLVHDSVSNVVFGHELKFITERLEARLGDPIPSLGASAREAHRVLRYMIECGVAASIAAEIRHALVIRMESWLKNYCACVANAERSCIPEAIFWLWTTLHPVASDVLRPDNLFQLFDGLLSDLMLAIYKIRAKMFLENLFVARYHGCAASAFDTRVCVLATRNYSMLLESVQKAVKCKLLNAGRSTEEIIVAYLNAQRHLRRVDPSGSLLSQGTFEIWNYVRSRSDAVKSILDILFAAEPAHTEHILAGGAIEIWNAASRLLAIREDIVFDYQWIPEFFPTDNNDLNTHFASADILAIVVNLFKSKEIFVDEYRRGLATRALFFPECSRFDLSGELDVIKRLQTRLGEDLLEPCHAMVRDLRFSHHLHCAWSRSLSQKRHDDLSAVYGGTVITYTMWPELQREDTHQLHSSLAMPLDQYSKFFAENNRERRVEFMPELGCAKVRVETSDGEIHSVSCRPLDYSFVLYMLEAFENLYSGSKSSTSTSIAQRNKEAASEVGDELSRAIVAVDELAKAAGSTIKTACASLACWAELGFLHVLVKDGRGYVGPRYSRALDAADREEDFKKIRSLTYAAVKSSQASLSKGLKKRIPAPTPAEASAFSSSSFSMTSFPDAIKY